MCGDRSEPGRIAVARSERRPLDGRCRAVCCEAGELGVRASAARIAPGVVVVPCRLMVDSRTMRPDPEPIPFGVGCFYFVPTEPAPETGQSARYRDLIQAALEAIPNTNNIVIEGGEDPDPLLLPLQGSWPSLDAPVFNAYPSYLNIEFDLYIPARIQEQILNSLGEGFVGSEHFHVRLIHSDMPLVMVTATEPVGWKAGSTYIILVREYLQRELDESMVGLSCLGPSPFHSDFSLELGQQQGRPLIVRREQPTLGYSQHWCSYESSGHDDENDIRQALSEVLAELTPELTVFYDASRQRLLRMRAWEKIEEPVRTSLLGDGCWCNAVRNRLRQSRSIRLVTARLIEFEMHRIFARQELEESLDRTYSIPGRAYLRDQVEKAAKNLGEYPIDEVYRLIEFLEGRRSKQVELLVVLIAAVVAGIAGGIAAWSLGPGGAPPVS